MTRLHQTDTLDGVAYRPIVAYVTSKSTPLPVWLQFSLLAFSCYHTQRCSRFKAQCAGIVNFQLLENWC